MQSQCMQSQDKWMHISCASHGNAIVSEIQHSEDDEERAFKFLLPFMVQQSKDAVAEAKANGDDNYVSFLQFWVECLKYKKILSEP
jgi:hypothetical protein